MPVRINQSQHLARHIAGVATVVLVVLKLAEVDTVAAWSWWAVLFGPTLIVTGLILDGLYNRFVMRENFRLRALGQEAREQPSVAAIREHLE